METSQPENGPEKKPSGRPGKGWSVFIGLLFLLLLLVAMFGCAGRLDWTAGWVYLGLAAAAQTISHLIVKRKNPDVLIHRRKIGAGTKGWDRAWIGILRLLFIAIVLVAALDAVRYGWSAMALWLWPFGFLLMAIGQVIATWALAVNPHFEGTVRIQQDRDHRVIDTGPYRTVRHPGYAGIILILLGMPFLLGSWWAFVPTLITIGWVLLRTVLEDGLLKRELAGYAGYAQRVRFRLVPGMW